MVDADDLALQVEKWSAGIAVIDRRIDLDELIVRRAIEIAMQGADNARRDGPFQPERIADRQNSIADTQVVAVAALDGRQRITDVHLQNGKIESESFAQKTGFGACAILESDPGIGNVLRVLVPGRHC